MIYILVFFFFLSVSSVDDFFYYVEIFKPLNNQKNYSPPQTFEIPEAHIEGIRKILKKEEEFDYGPALYVINLAKATASLDQITNIYNANLTLTSVHKLAPFIPAVIAEYK
jgi:hypothetical protein